MTRHLPEKTSDKGKRKRARHVGVQFLFPLFVIEHVFSSRVFLIRYVVALNHICFRGYRETFEAKI